MFIIEILNYQDYDVTEKINHLLINLSVSVKDTIETEIEGTEIVNTAN